MNATDKTLPPRKTHTEDRRKFGRALCGVPLPNDFNPWREQGETCERCARIKAAKKEIASPRLVRNR